MIQTMQERLPESGMGQIIPVVAVRVVNFSLIRFLQQVQEKLKKLELDPKILLRGPLRLKRLCNLLGH